MKSKLIYHKDNVEKMEFKVEEYLRHEDPLTLYGILKGLTIAVGYILDEMEKRKDEKEDVKTKL